MNYFAYGMNLNHFQMRKRCPNAQPIGRCLLPGWRLAFDGVATLIECPDTLVHGGLWHITPACEKALDILEGYPRLYQKKHFVNSSRDIFFYVMPHDFNIAPSEAYLNMLLNGLDDFGYAPHGKDIAPYLHPTDAEEERDLQLIHILLNSMGQAAYHSFCEAFPRFKSAPRRWGQPAPDDRWVTRYHLMSWFDEHYRSL